MMRKRPIAGCDKIGITASRYAGEAGDTAIGTSMRKHPLGVGEWVGAGYLALVLGTLIGGLFGANEWFEIVIAFGAAAMVAVVVERIIAAVDWPRRTPTEEERGDG